MLATRPVNELSGGERALVLMARALAVEAPTLLADEPAAMLDPAHQLQIMELLKSIAGQSRTVVAVLHDLALAARYCARLVMMRHGRIVADGTPQDVLSPAMLRQAYGVEGVVVERADGRVVLPWRRIGA
jgi:iron complex transport system ATP-binding protein